MEHELRKHNKMQEDIDSLFNIIRNLSLYTQKDVIGPHNVNEFLEILSKDNMDDFNYLVEHEFEKYKKDTSRRLRYDPDYPEIVNKQRMWISMGSHMIHSRLRESFESITNIEPVLDI